MSSPVVVVANGGAVDVTQLHVPHPDIRAEDWRSPLVYRLSGKREYLDGRVSIEGSYRAIDSDPAITQFACEWVGLKSDFERCVNTYQAPVITEFATLGLACVLISRFTDLRITEVTRRGERVDYWVGDAGRRKKYVLEVGGVQSGDMQSLSSAKTTQLNGNPWERDGFICVAVYESLRARLWFCRYTGEA